MEREFSAGGVVVRRMQAQWWIAAIEPAGRGAPGAKPAAVVALPKGMVDKGEKPQETALREVREETGINASLVCKLKDIKYFYVRSWGDRARIFKIVSFYLLRYQSGKLGEISDEMRQEVQRALWLPLQDAPHRLTYKGEREVATLALHYLERNPEF